MDTFPVLAIHTDGTTTVLHLAAGGADAALTFTPLERAVGGLLESTTLPGRWGVMLTRYTGRFEGLPHNPAARALATAAGLPGDAPVHGTAAFARIDPRTQRLTGTSYEVVTTARALHLDLSGWPACAGAAPQDPPA